MGFPKNVRIGMDCWMKDFMGIWVLLMYLETARVLATCQGSSPFFCLPYTQASEGCGLFKFEKQGERSMSFIR